jgi:hypothetical protein
MDREDMIKVENFYEYDPSLMSYDTGAQQFSYFYVSISGQIEFGEFGTLDGLAVRYAFVYGDDWKVSSGSQDGKGQYAFKGNANSLSGVKRLVWNMPFEV